MRRFDEIRSMKRISIGEIEQKSDIMYASTHKEARKNMKRIQAACLHQTIHFQLKEDVEHDEAVRMVQEEYEHYKKQLEHRHIRHKILGEQVQPDGSILIRIAKQYVHHSVGDYLD